MGIGFKIAWRNLWRHKGKSLVMGIILFCGAMLMTVGNGMISGMEHGLSENIVNLFTGDLVIISKEQQQKNVLFNEDGESLKVIKNFDATKKVLEQEPLIADFLPATAGMAMFLAGSDTGNLMLLGLDMNRYRTVFPQSIQIIEGRTLEPGEKGLLVSEETRKQNYEFLDIWMSPQGEPLKPAGLTAEARKNINNLDIRRDLVLMGTSSSNSGMDIRVPVTGIFKYKSLNKIWGSYCIIDIESFREANNLLTGADSQVEISAAKKKLLEDDQLDQYFSTGNLIETSSDLTESFSVQNIQNQTRRETNKTAVDSGSYNIVLVKLKKGIAQDKALHQLNQSFIKKGLNVKAVGWKEAVGSIGNIAMMLKGSLSIFIIFIFFVAIIVIMNTLSMAALERVPEIGMMRAVGAQKRFLQKMFVYETGLLSFFFGGLGIAVGVIIIYLLQAANIATTDEFLQLVYGGDRLNPVFTMVDFILGIINLGIVSFLAVLYPLRVVGKIAPLDAVNKD